MPIFLGDHEFVNVGELKLGAGIDVQQVYLGQILIWPAAGLDTHYRLAESGCKRVIEGDTTVGGDFRVTEADVGIISSGVQAIFDRMCALEPAEVTAITNFYNCAVLNGLWDKLVNIWGLGMNQLDYQTAWKDDRISLTPDQTGPLIPSTPNAPIWQNDGSNRVLFSTNRFFRMASPAAMFNRTCHGFFVYNNAWATFDGDYFQDLYGSADIDGTDYYNRWRGQLLNAYDLDYGTDGPLPRPTLIDFSGDNRWGDAPGVIGGWHDGTRDYVLCANDIVRSAARTPTSLPSAAFQFPGSNAFGSNQNQTAWQYLSMAVLISADSWTTTDTTNLRACMLQFCRDIGVQNVPPT